MKFTKKKNYNFFPYNLLLYILPIQFEIESFQLQDKSFVKYLQITESTQINYWRKNFFQLYFESLLLNSLFFASNTKWPLNKNTAQSTIKNSYYNKILSNTDNYFVGLFFLFNFFSKWAFSILCFVFTTYTFLLFKIIILNKVLYSWTILTFFIYLLVSGFVFFSKKYRFGKFTTSIQRFWKRTYILFWLIESSLFLVFFYLTFNSSEEIHYMYDQIKFFKTHFVSWKLFISKVILVVILILNTYYCLFYLKWNTFSKNSNFILINTIILLIILWVEFYQLFHISSFYSNISWYYDYDEYMWSLEYEFKRTRLVNNYMSLCLFAKFWHMFFIFIFWVFFSLRSNENSNAKFLFLTSNYQNFLILYMLSWLYMYPWAKFILRNFLDTTYYWFLANVNDFTFKVLFGDFVNFLLSTLKNLLIEYSSKKLTILNFYYFVESSHSTFFINCKSNVIKNLIIHNI